jgi:hypothetical protein
VTKIIKTITILSLIVISLSACSRDADIKAVNKANGKIIIDAVYEYKKDHGSFPTDLAVMVPDYLPKIPTTLGSEDFFYKTNSIEGFLLGFNVRLHYGCGYTDRFKEWECGSGD